MKEKLYSNLYPYSLVGFILILIISRFINTFITFQYNEYSISIPCLLYIYFLLNFCIFKKINACNVNNKMFLISFLVLYMISLIPLASAHKLSYSMGVTILIRFVIEIIYPSVIEEFFYRKIMMNFLFKYIHRFYILIHAVYNNFVKNILSLL